MKKSDILKHVEEIRRIIRDRDCQEYDYMEHDMWCNHYQSLLEEIEKILEKIKYE